jgi:hypothetical protein
MWTTLQIFILDIVAQRLPFLGSLCLFPRKLGETPFEEPNA